MEESLSTPSRKEHRLLLDNSLSRTPNPQATSTVARHVHTSFALEAELANFDRGPLNSHESSGTLETHGNFLSGAIDDMRTLSNQLARGQSISNSENMPPRNHKSRPARPDSVSSRRSSGLAESIGNSSLGILNVNELECDALDVSRASSVLGFSESKNAADDTFDWRGFSTRSILTESNRGSPTPSLTGLRLNQEDVAADLRLRTQKALARQAISKATSKHRSVLEADLAQLDSLLPSLQTKKNSSQTIEIPGLLSRTEDARRISNSSSSAEDPSPEASSQGYPFSPRSTSIPDLSKESFVSGELALNRLDQDQDSWRKNFGCFPSMENLANDRASDVSSRPVNVTQNLDLSLSGVISGDVTVSSSLEAVTEKKRISAGEYFGLRSENLGLFDADSPVPPRESLRPNFGQEIHSPTRVRRMPLVENSQRLSYGSLDKVPTKDTGLDRPSLNSLDFTFDSSVASHRKSTDLMPPPPPPSESAPRRESTRSRSRRSLQAPASTVSQSKRLSMSMTDVAAPGPDADVSYMSMDESGRRASNQTVASLSHIAQLLSDMSGHMSTRLVVDNLLENCSVPSKARPKSSTADSQSEGSGDTSKQLPVTPKSGTSTVREKTPTPPCDPVELSNVSVKQRVNEWMSRSDATADEQHGSDEVQAEKMLASNSPAKGATPRQSMYSDISSAGLSDRRMSSPKAPSACGGSCAPPEAAAPNVTHSTPMIGSRKRTVPDHKTDAARALSVHSKTSAERTPSPKTGSQKTPSVCESAATMRTVSRHGDASSLSANSPFQVDSTHTQLSWPSVPLGASKSLSFALKNKSNGRVRLLVVSANPAFKLLGERGESVTELTVAMHCEEARRINVVFSPNACGPLASRLVISRIGASDSEQRRERRLIPLYGTGGQALVNLEGAPKDQWAQWFVNLTYVDGDLCGATFCARNTGDAPAFVNARICTEGVPFSDCGVTISPSSLILIPGQSARFSVRWDPKVEVLEWLSENAGDVHVLANVWLSWAELATWQRITRLYLKYYKDGRDGPLANWVPCKLNQSPSEDPESWQLLKDSKGAEGSLVQSVRRIKVAVLGEREMLRGFDLDVSAVFQQLTVNDTVMMASPSGREDNRKNASFAQSSPGFSELSAASAIPRYLSQQRQQTELTEGEEESALNEDLDLDLDLTTAPVRSDSYVVRFPETIVNHKTCAKIKFNNFSTEQHHVVVRSVAEPFLVPTSKFFIDGDWYMNMRVFFQPKKPGLVRRPIEIWVDGQYKLTYELVAEGIAAE